MVDKASSDALAMFEVELASGTGELGAESWWTPTARRTIRGAPEVDTSDDEKAHALYVGE